MAGPRKNTTPNKRFAAQAQNVFEEYGTEAHDGFDWAAHTEAVAADIFGACNEQRSRPPEDVRFGNKGSVSVNYTEGKWYDFENKRGGGIKELIRVYKGIEGRDEAIAYAKECLNGEKPSEQQRAHAKGNENGQQREHEATYIYHDADGQVAFEVVRSAFKETDGSYATDTKGKRIKAFSQRRPSGEPDGCWLWGLGAGEFMRAAAGKDWKAFSDSKFSQYPALTRQRKAFDSAAPMVPYRLPELLKALAANQTILIPEGEKKVERIRELGFSATCNAGGAKKWASEHTAYLRGADVVLLPDNDEVGREHMQTIANGISGVAKRVRILDLPGLPEKGDVVDWQGTAEEFAYGCRSAGLCGWPTRSAAAADAAAAAAGAVPVRCPGAGAHRCGAWHRRHRPSPN